MLFSIPIRLALASLVASAHLTAQIEAPQAQAAETRTVTVGTHVRLQLTREIERVAVGDPNVLEVELLSTTEALVLGKQTGRLVNGALAGAAEGDVVERGSRRVSLTVRHICEFLLAPEAFVEDG